MKMHWLLTSVVAMGLVGAPLMSGAAESEKQVKFRDLPKAVQETVDRERGKREVKQIDHVVRDGKDWYRVTIDTKGPDSVLRISDGGKVMSEQEVADTSSVKVRPAEVRATPGDEGKPVNFDDLSGAVKSAIGREAQNKKVVSVTTYEHRNKLVYRAVVTDGNRENVIRVLGDGSVYTEVDDTAAGSKEVAYDALPYNPKVALGKELGADKPGKITQITKADGKTYYQAEIVGSTGTRVVQISDDGKISPVEQPSIRRRGK